MQRAPLPAAFRGTLAARPSDRPAEHVLMRSPPGVAGAGIWRRCDPALARRPHACAISGSTARRSAPSPPRSAASAEITCVRAQPASPPVRLEFPPPHHHHHESITTMHAAIANTVPATAQPQGIDRYARCIEVSKRIRWDIDRDVIRGRSFDFGEEVPARRPVEGRPARLPAAGRERACCRRSRAAPTPTCSRLVERFIGAKTARARPRPLARATRSRSKRWCGSPTRS